MCAANKGNYPFVARTIRNGGNDRRLNPVLLTFSPASASYLLIKTGRDEV